MRRLSRISGPRCARPLGPLDQRTTAWRADLADIALAPLVAVPHYARPAAMRVAAVRTPLLAAGHPGATPISELLLGEGFRVLDVTAGFAWGQAAADGYVGHVALADLAVDTPGERVRVGPGDALLFETPSIKAPVKAAVPMGAELAAVAHDRQFLQIAAGPFAGAYLHRRHAGGPAPDWVAIAETFRGAPYRWGGRTRAGVDCSGLVQASRQAAGLPTRRDSDMQRADTRAVAAETARRGDVACWPGHIGILLDAGTLLHANAHWMACVVEPLADAVARAAGAGGPAQPEVRRFAD